MTSIVMLVRDRPRLTDQALESIYNHSVPGHYTLTIMDDGSLPATRKLLVDRTNTVVCHFSRSIGILGFLRNIGAQVSEKVFGRSDWLCFLDNDVAVFEGWLPALMELGSRLPLFPRQAFVIGGQRHPFHQATTAHNFDDCMVFNEVDAVAGYSMFMSWDTWDRFGPFDANAKGIGQSEDWAFSRRVKKGGGIVGYTPPPVLAHCGVTDSLGKPATGHEAFERFPGLIYE